MTRSRRLLKPHHAMLMSAMLVLGACDETEPDDVASTPIARTSLSDTGSKLDSVERGGMSTASLHDLLDLDDRVPLEASGVALGRHAETSKPVWSVAFDNFTALGLLSQDLEAGDLLVDEESDTGYEGLTFDARTGLYYAVVEGVEKKKRIEPEIHVYDSSWTLIDEHQVDFEIEDVNKGMEGLAHVYHDDEFYLFMLCESNRCERKGDPGEGRIYVFSLDDDGEEWEEVDRIKLPEELEFEDYSGLDVLGDQIIVSSQEDSALWRGELVLEIEDDSAPNWKIDEDGEIFELPRKSGKMIYCNIEGVAFDVDAPERLVMVSDRRKPEQSKRCEDGDESLHLIELPTR